MNTVEQTHWEVLIDHEDYEICSEFPHQIRKRSNGRIVSEWVDRGYLRVNLNKRKFQKHILIAQQFIDNPDPELYTMVDHINHNKTDNRVENLRWVSQRMNNNNRSDQELVDDIPDEAIRVTDYNKWTFEELYFYDDVFYTYNGISYAIKPKFQTKAGYWFVQVCDTTGVRRTIYYTKFKREYELI